MTDRGKVANGLEKKERRQTRDKIFLTVLGIWVPFLIALWLGLFVHGHDWKEIIGTIITVLGLLATVIERNYPRNWLYRLGLGLALGGVLVAHGATIISAFN